MGQVAKFGRRRRTEDRGVRYFLKKLKSSVLFCTGIYSRYIYIPEETTSELPTCHVCTAHCSCAARLAHVCTVQCALQLCSTVCSAVSESALCYTSKPSPIRREFRRAANQLVFVATMASTVAAARIALPHMRLLAIRAAEVAYPTGNKDFSIMQPFPAAVDTAESDPFLMWGRCDAC